MQSNSRFKLVIYDLDGVITSTSYHHFAAWKWLIKDTFNIKIANEIEELTKGVSRKDSLKEILKQYNIDIPQEMFEQLLEVKNQYYIESLTNLTKDDILPNIIEQLKYLKEQGIKIALGSASHNALFVLEKLQIKQYFDYIVNPQGLRGKPFPDIFVNAMKHFDLKPHECIGIEDSVSGVKAIRDANILTIGIGNKQELNDANIIFQNMETFTLSELIGILNYE